MTSWRPPETGSRTKEMPGDPSARTAWFAEANVANPTPTATRADLKLRALNILASPPIVRQNVRYVCGGPPLASFQRGGRDLQNSGGRDLQKGYEFAVLGARRRVHRLHTEKSLGAYGQLLAARGHCGSAWAVEGGNVARGLGGSSRLSSGEIFSRRSGRRQT